MTVLTNCEADPINSLGGVRLSTRRKKAQIRPPNSKRPTLTARHGHALKRTVTNNTALVEHHVLTVLTNSEADPINTLGGVRSNTRGKKRK